MKFNVTFKTPDAFFYAKQNLKKYETPEEDMAAVDELEKKFVAYGEFVTIEFDTETMSATVLKDNGYG